MRSAEAISDHLRTLLVQGMPAQVLLLSQLAPTIALPDIEEVYIEEYDYDQLDKVPSILLMQQEPELVATSGDLVEMDLPIDIVVWDIASGTGMSELHRRLFRYRRGIVDLLLTCYRVQPGYWDSMLLTDYVAGPPMELAGRYGRAKGVRMSFRVCETY